MDHSSHDAPAGHHGAHHAPEPKEFSHSLLWLVGLLIAVAVIAGWFIYWFAYGSKVGRDMGELKRHSAAVVEPDHKMLLATVNDDILVRGQTVYNKNCASCHGVGGLLASQPSVRNLSKDAFKSPDGAGPFGIYLTLTNGLNSGMPSYKTLSAEDRYAMVHYVREKILKDKNPSQYVGDAPAVVAKIPAPGAGHGGDDKTVPAHLTKPPKGLPVLLAQTAKGADEQARALEAWISASGLSEEAQRVLRSSGSATILRLRTSDQSQGEAILIELFPLATSSQITAMRAALFSTAKGVTP